MEQPSTLAALIRLAVISSLNHGDATEITDGPGTLLRVQTVMGISIDISLKGSVSPLFTLQAAYFPLHTKETLLPSEFPLWPSARQTRSITA